MKTLTDKAIGAMDKKSYHRGAGEAKRDFLAHLIGKRRRLYKNGAAESVLDEWDRSIKYVRERKIRYRARKGGL